MRFTQFISRNVRRYVEYRIQQSIGNAEAAGYFAPILDSVTEQTRTPGVFRHIMFDVPEIKPPSNIERASIYMQRLPVGSPTFCLFPSYIPRSLHAENHKVRVFDYTTRCAEREY